MDDEAASPVGRLDSPVDKGLIFPVDECIPVEICSPSRWLIGKGPDDSYDVAWICTYVWQSFV